VLRIKPINVIKSCSQCWAVVDSSAILSFGFQNITSCVCEIKCLGGGFVLITFLGVHPMKPKLF
jgi:hypothetical protein